MLHSLRFFTSWKPDDGANVQVLSVPVSGQCRMNVIRSRARSFWHTLRPVSVVVRNPKSWQGSARAGNALNRCSEAGFPEGPRRAVGRPKSRQGAARAGNALHRFSEAGFPEGPWRAVWNPKSRQGAARAGNALNRYSEAGFPEGPCRAVGKRKSRQGVARREML